jgi:cholesterol transport system auxiliary component
MTETRGLVASVLLASVVVPAAGCLGLSRAYPEKRYFALEAPPRGAAKGAPESGVLRVNPFRVGPLYEGNELVHRSGEVEYESDFYNEWFVPPGPMLTRAFEDWMGTAGVFEHVIPAGASVDATAAMGGLVTALHGDYREEAARAVLGVDVYVVSGEDSPRIILQNGYSKEVAIPNRSAEALARGLNEALRLLLVDLEADLRKLDLKQR